MNAEHRDISAEEYHADPAIGASMIEDFISSRRLFEGRYVTKTIPPKAQTPAMKLGTLIHLRILEPQRFAEVVAPPTPENAPDGKKWNRRKGSDHEKWWVEYLASIDGKIECDEETLATIEAIAESVLSKRWARRLIDGDGQSEFSILWTDADTGLKCKVRVDWFSAICLDLKSSADPSPFSYAKSLVGLGYHRKLAHYRQGIQTFTGEETPLIHLAVGTQPPYCAGAYDIDDRDRNGKSLGYRQWKRALKEIADCFDRNDFSEPWETQICSLALPAFAFSEDAYHMGANSNGD